MYEIKRWFMDKEFNQNEKYMISVSDVTELKETEKAVFLKFTSDFGTILKWVPKSCLMTDEDYAIEATKAKRSTDRRQSLLEFAKENGIKTRINSKTKTILRQLSQEALKEAYEKELITQFTYFMYC